MLDPKLLNILVGPVSKAPLVYDEEKQELLCKASGLAYPVRDGIPVMLEEEARALTTDEKLDCQYCHARYDFWQDHSWRDSIRFFV